MSNGFYEFQVVGVLVKDPEVKTSKAGKEYVTFTVGTTKSSKEGDQWRNDKEYHNFIAGGKSVDYVKRLSKMDIVRATSNSASYTSSGDKIYINYLMSSVNVISKASNQNFAKSEQQDDDIPADIPF